MLSVNNLASAEFKGVTLSNTADPEQQAWLHKFIGFDFTVEYKLGKDDQVADDLSRVFYMAWSEPQVNLFLDLKQEIQQNSDLPTIL